MSDAWTKLIERIHAAQQQAVIAVTGGGASAIAKLLQVPGGSRTLLEAIVPYSAAALTDWLGMRPERFCTEDTALSMAAVAFQRAKRLTESAPSSAPLIGLACTASLLSDRPKKGDHRCHLATQTRTETAAWQLILQKGARDRAAEERLTGQMVLCALARAAGLADLPSPDLENDEAVVEHRTAADPLLVEVLDGKRCVVWSLPGPTANSKVETNTGPNVGGFSLHAEIPVPFSPPAGLLCGSFHPLHFGHLHLREVAARILGGPVYYEMSVRNVDKPPLDYLSIDRRRAQFIDEPLALTTAPTFAEKAVALPGVTFVVGADTAERIVAPRYYGDTDGKMRAALDQIANSGCRFLVAGRKTDERFETLADIALPPDFAKLFCAIPAEAFRADISSTELRRAESPQS